MTAARRDERAKIGEERKAIKPAAREAARAEVHDELERNNRLRNEANARARAAEKEAAKHERKVQRLEKKVKSLEDAEMADADDEMEDDPVSSDEDEPTHSLPFELLPRRDDKGRFQAESPDVHALRIAQLGRGGALKCIT